MGGAGLAGVHVCLRGCITVALRLLSVVTEEVAVGGRMDWHEEVRVDTPASRGRVVLVVVGLVALVVAVVCLWQAGRVDAAVRVWELGQTLDGAVALSAPVGGLGWRVGAGMSAFVAVVSGAVAYVSG